MATLSAMVTARDSHGIDHAAVPTACVYLTEDAHHCVGTALHVAGLSGVRKRVVPMYEQFRMDAQALREMGAQIQLYRECLGGLPCRFGQSNFKHSAVVSGPSKLHGANISVPDLRGGFSHLIAALTAEGTSRVHGIDLIDRGYEHVQDKLDALGARYERGGRADRSAVG